MKNIRTATFADYHSIIHFANTVFGEDFPTLLPKLYQQHPEYAQHHLLLENDNAINALLGAFPLTFSIGNQDLHCVGIGTVCVHPDARHRGYMSQLFDYLMPELQKLAIDVAFLGGQRQRYEPWGFTPSGTTYSFQLTIDNARHAQEPLFQGSFRLATKDDHFFAQALQLYNQHDFALNRTQQTFWEISQTWQNQLTWIFDEHNNWLGYCISNPEKTSICECYLLDNQNLLAIYYAWSQHYQLSTLEVTQGPSDDGSFQALTTACEKLQITTNTNFAILNFPRVIQATLQAKAAKTPLLSGRVTIQIGNDTPVAIEIAQGVVTVSPTATAEVHLTQCEATRLLFSPEAVQIEHPLLRSWAPLPLFISPSDNV
ncbi:MAG: GNAT family N-acetyltransferase [Culicoidibacterales bacterium]